MEIGKGEHMSIKIFGAFCIIAACGTCGFSMAAQHLRKIRRMNYLLSAVEYMMCELQCRCTPLPQLCRQAGLMCQGKVKQVFLMLSDELDAQISPNVHCCMEVVIAKIGELERPLKEAFAELGRNLGKFDLTGQLQGLQRTQKKCEEILQQLVSDKDSKLRSYQTLGLCAGAAIAIIFV